MDAYNGRVAFIFFSAPFLTTLSLFTHWITAALQAAAFIKLQHQFHDLFPQDCKAHYYIGLGRNGPIVLFHRWRHEIWLTVLSPSSSIPFEFHYKDAEVNPTAATVNKQNLNESYQGSQHSASLILVKQMRQLIFIGWIMLSSVVTLCYKQPAAEKLCWRKHLPTGWKQWVNNWGWMGRTECNSALLPGPSTVSMLVCSCYDSSPPEFCPTKERLEWIHLLPLSTRKLHFTVYFALFLFWRVITTLAENKDKNDIAFVKDQTYNYTVAPWPSRTKSLCQWAATI